MEKPNKLISMRYVKITFLCSVILGLTCYFIEYEIYRTQIRNKLIGLSHAWQSNANNENKVAETYPQNVASSYKDIENFIGIKTESNIKEWFDGYLEQVYNLDLAVNTPDNLGTKGINHDAIWQIGKDIKISSKVAYSKGRLLEGTNKRPNKVAERIFNEFIGYIKYSFPELEKGGRNKKHTLDFDRYNKIIVSEIFKKHRSDFVLTEPYIKVHRFFIACVDSADKATPNYSMAVYPFYADATFSGLNVPDRPWFQANVENFNMLPGSGSIDSKTRFPLHYASPKEKNYQAYFGLTGLYNDIATTTATVLDRTFTCVFSVPNDPNKTRFIACLDLFFDNSVDFECPSPFVLSRKASTEISSIVGGINFLNFPNYSPGICMTIDSIILFLLTWGLLQVNWIKSYVIRGLEGIINQIKSENTILFKIKRTMVNSLNADNVDDPPKVETESIVRMSNRDIQTVEVGIEAEVKWYLVLFKMGRNRRTETVREQNVGVTTTVELTLGIDNVNYYRRIEFWKIYYGSKAAEAGTFIVKWLNPIYTREEIAIDIEKGQFKLKLPAKKRNEVLALLKKEFEGRLLTTETEQHEIRIDLKLANERPMDIPSSIENCVIDGESIISYFTKKGQLHRFYEQKIFFRYRENDLTEFNYFRKLYENMQISSTCGIAFLENLEKNNILIPFLQSTREKERLFIESSDGELFNFIEALEPATKQEFKQLKLSKFLVYSYQNEHLENINKFKNYDFAVVKNSLGVTQLILYHTPVSTKSEIGWASWRSIDIDFYQAVFKIIKRDVYVKGVTIDDYLKTK